jgi:hypothetical protein
MEGVEEVKEPCPANLGEYYFQKSCMAINPMSKKSNNVEMSYGTYSLGFQHHLYPPLQGKTNRVEKSNIEV